jgi:hypothetical protein
MTALETAEWLAEWYLWAELGTAIFLEAGYHVVGIPQELSRRDFLIILSDNEARRVLFARAFAAAVAGPTTMKNSSPADGEPQWRVG